MEAAGYGFHHQSEDGKYLIMGNGTQAFAISAEPVQEKDNPLRTAEMTLEDDYGMIDGVINNGRRGEEVEKAKPSIRERLEDAKRECSERKPPEKGRPSREAPEHGER
jgi:Lon protease-like protein